MLRGAFAGLLAVEATVVSLETAAGTTGGAFLALAGDLMDPVACGAGIDVLALVAGAAPPPVGVTIDFADLAKPALSLPGRTGMLLKAA